MNTSKNPLLEPIEMPKWLTLRFERGASRVNGRQDSPLERERHHAPP